MEISNRLKIFSERYNDYIAYLMSNSRLVQKDESTNEETLEENKEFNRSIVYE